MGAPLDELPTARAVERVATRWCGAASDGARPIQEPLQTGLRVLDGMLTVGRGQTNWYFWRIGCGKEHVDWNDDAQYSCDITVVGLVGERGREVREFVEDSLGEEGRKRSVVLVSTSDQSPLLRMRAAMAATSVAEFYAASGKHVLLVLDSLTRYAMAAREIGLAAGEPPASKGYTPIGVYEAGEAGGTGGNFETGSITAFYTVLMEGDDQQDPVVDAVRSLSGWARGVVAADGGGGMVSAGECAGFAEPVDACGNHAGASGAGGVRAEVAGGSCAVGGSGAHWSVQGRD